ALAQELEHVRGDEPVARRIEAIQLEVLPRELQRIGVAVDGDHLASAAQRRAQGKAAGIAEAVQGARAAAGEAAQGKAVLALVEKVSGLLSGAQVDKNPHSVLLHGQLRGRLRSPQNLSPRGRTVAIAQLVVAGVMDDLLVASVDAV